MNLKPGERRILRSLGIMTEGQAPGEKAHNGAEVTITGIVENERKDSEGTCYSVRADDGWEGEAFGFELHEIRHPVMVTWRERDTIIAALRLWQAVMVSPGISPGLAEIADNGREGPDARLSSAEIDQMIEGRINA